MLLQILGVNFVATVLGGFFLSQNESKVKFFHTRCQQKLKWKLHGKIYFSLNELNENQSETSFFFFVWNQTILWKKIELKKN